MKKFIALGLLLQLVACGPQPRTVQTLGSEPAPTERPPVRSALTIDSPDGMPPIDRSVIPEAEDRWNSPQARHRHEEVMSQLWRTTLGQMYLGYLTDELDPKIVPGRAKQVIDRIYEDSEFVGRRLQLIQFLTQDLYGRQRMSEDVMKRVVIFDRITHTKETTGEEKNSDRLINLMIVSALVALPFGSPVVREEFANLWSHSKRVCPWRECDVRAVDWRRVANFRNFFRDYRAGSAAGTFLAVGGGASMMYSLGLEKLPGWRKYQSTDEKMLNGLDELLDEAEF